MLRGLVPVPSPPPGLCAAFSLPAAGPGPGSMGAEEAAEAGLPARWENVPFFLDLENKCKVSIDFVWQTYVSRADKSLCSLAARQYLQLSGKRIDFSSPHLHLAAPRSKFARQKLTECHHWLLSAALSVSGCP